MPDISPNNLYFNYMMAQNPSAAINYQRQQAIAQQLMDSGNAPDMAPNTLANPGGYVINQSPYGMLGKALEKGMGGYLQGKNQAALAQALQGKQPDIGAATNAAIGSSEGPATAQAVSQQLGQQMQSGQPQNDPTTVTGNAMGDMLLAQTNPERYKFLAAVKEAQVSKTPEQKNAEYGTSNNTPAGGLVLGAMTKGAILPGQTYNGRTDVPIDTRTGQPFGGSPPISPPNLGDNSVMGRTLPNGTRLRQPSAPPLNANNQVPTGNSIPPIPAAPANPQGSPQNIPNNAQVAGFGVPLGGTSGANKNAEDLADAQKTFNVAVSSLPRALQRFDELRKAAPLASYGTVAGAGEDGQTGLQQKLQNSAVAQAIDPRTAVANSTIHQAANQGILSELGPQLAGLRGNKFLEQIAGGASGLDAAAPPQAKLNVINGLQDQYVANLKSLAAQRRNYGDLSAPSDAAIDAMVSKSMMQINPPNLQDLHNELKKRGLITP